MILIGLLVVAAVCVVLGVVLASVGWLVASLVASVLAALVLARSYFRARGGAEVGAAKRPHLLARRGSSASDEPSAAELSSAAFATGATAPAERVREEAGAVATQTRTVLVVDGHPDYHGAGCLDLEGRETVAIAYDQAVEDGFVACPLCNGLNNGVPSGAVPATTPPPHGSEDGEHMVLVVDGLPDYHVEGCTRLSGQDTVAIPHGQALEDGFAPCTTCDPESGVQQVWVADGYPEYHRADCAQLAGHEALDIPHDQAVEDGFTPCAQCDPDSDPAAAAPVGAQPVAAGAEVWVIDGQPNYHRADCVELVGQAGEAVPHEQAVEDGFAECAVCTPESDAPRAAPAEPAASRESAGATPATEAREVFVADGFPDYHLGGCPAASALTLVPLPFDDAVQFGFTSCSTCDPAHNTTLPASTTEPQPVGDTVVVADGFPHYHRSGCSELAGLHEEPVPHDQAVEDGFVPCAVCQPDGAATSLSKTPSDASAADAPGAADLSAQAPTADAPAADTADASAPDASAPDASAPAAQDARETVRLPAGGLGVAGAAPVAAAGAPQYGSPREVLVVDGYPCYHLPGCAELEGLDEEPVPHDQAVEDGFQACPVCRPEGSDTAAAGAGQVVVVDGYPEYHLEGCAQLAGLDAEAVPYEQAVEDGFSACEVCHPDRAQGAAPTVAPDDTQQADPAQDGATHHDSGNAPVDASADAPPAVAAEAPPAEAPPAEAAEAPPAEPEVAHADTAPADTAPADAARADAARADAARADSPTADTSATPAEAQAEPVVDEAPGVPEAAGPTEPGDAAGDSEAATTEHGQTVAPPADDAPQSEPTTSEPAAADTAPAAEPEPGTEAGTVWVVDSRPRFHAEGCLIIKGQQAQPMPKEQAEQDGFRPCSLCQR